MKKKYSKGQKGFKSDKYRRQAKKRFQRLSGSTNKTSCAGASASPGKRSPGPALLGLWPFHIPATPMECPTLFLSLQGLH